MDIEGAELKALIGAEKTIKKYRPNIGNKLFTILKPVEPEKVGLKDDEALVFSVEYNEDICEDYLERVTDEADIEILFQIYYDMLDEQGITE